MLCCHAAFISARFSLIEVKFYCIHIPPSSFFSISSNLSEFPVNSSFFLYIFHSRILCLFSGSF
jgi:hypothetical protein